MNCEVSSPADESKCLYLDTQGCLGTISTNKSPPMSQHYQQLSSHTEAQMQHIYYYDWGRYGAWVQSTPSRGGFRQKTNYKVCEGVC